MSETSINPAPFLDSPEDISRRGYPLSRSGRVLLGLWSLALVAGFAVAAWLEPDPRGFGTHQKLGLPPCSFQFLLGVDCPSCGSTTCFAHFVRGDWLSAAQSNSAAFVLALTCAVMIPWSWYGVWQGRLWKVEQPATWCLWLLTGLCGLSIGQWFVRLNWS